MDHDDRILDQFSKQAIPFSEARPISDEDALDRLIGFAGVRPDSDLLDVACGPGQLALRAARTARHVTALDVTPAMLERGLELAADMPTANIDWRLGSSYQLPFDDESFDVVTCRYAFHHMERPFDALQEMFRVTRHCGAVVVCDGVASDNPEKARAFNDFERKRDPSTVRFMTEGELIALFISAGCPASAALRYRMPAELEGLMNTSFPESQEIAEEIRQSLIASEADDSLGLLTCKKGKRYLFSYPILALQARKS